MAELDKHISKNYFFEVIEKRLREYEEAILGTKMAYGTKLHMATCSLHNIQELKTTVSLYNLFDSSFWGYE